MYLITGDDEYRKREAVGALRARAVGDGDPELNLHSFHGEEATVREMIETAGTVPSGAAHRVVIVHAVDKLPDEGQRVLLECLARPPRGAVLILVTTAGVRGTAFLKAVGRLAVTQTYETLGPAEAKAWVRQRVRQAGKAIAEAAVQHLVDLGGSDLALLEHAVEQAVLFTGACPRIERGDVQDFVSPRPLERGFPLADALADRDLPRALTVLGRVIDGGADAQQILGIMAWQYRRLWVLRQLQARGAPARQVMATAGIPPFELSRLTAKARAFSPRDLETAVGLLVEADLELKRTSTASRWILETLVCRLCRAA